MSYGAFTSALAAAHAPTARFGSDVTHDKSVWMLADYLDEVDKQIGEFDVFMRELAHNPKGDTCSQALFGRWGQFVNAAKWGRYSTGEPYGWRDYFNEYRTWFPGLISDDPLWAWTEMFEDELIVFYDEAVACGAKPSTKRPEPAHQKPPPEETPLGQFEDVAGKLVLVAGVVGVAYLLHGAAALKGAS